MELTSNFRSLVKTLRSRSKALGKTGDLCRSAPKERKETHFNKCIKELVCSISEMKSFLLTHRTDYIDQHFIMYNVSKMSDIEREEIDQNAQKFLSSSKQIIGQLRKQVKATAGNIQQTEHQLCVVAIVEDYLRLVGRIWAEQRALRIKRNKKMRTLGSLTGGRPIKEVSGKPVGDVADTESAADGDVSSVMLEELDVNEGSALPKEITSNEQHNGASDFKTSYSDDDHDALYEFRSVRITPEDVQILEQENTRLYDELNSMAEHVKQIEGRVVEITELQKRFNEKVIEQEDDVQRIALTMLSATENVKDANEQLRQAMQNHAGIRVAILFALIVLSCSLLFLDWYNP